MKIIINLNQLVMKLKKKMKKVFKNYQENG